MKNCILFPRLFLLEPLKLGELSLAGVHDCGVEPNSPESFVIDNSAFLISSYFHYTSTNFSICFFDSDDPFQEVVERYYPYLLIIRFAILCDEYRGDYDDTEYIIMQIKYDRRENGSLHFESYINGLQVMPGIILNSKKACANPVQPYMSSLQLDVENACVRFLTLPLNEQDAIKSGLHRFVLAHGPSRHVDPFTQIIGLVSGIERFVKLEVNEGKKEFGQRLGKIFGSSAFEDWGKQVYDLRSSLSHQRLDLPLDQSSRQADSERLFYRNPDETIAHTGHFRIARAILGELLKCGLFGGHPNKDYIVPLFSSQETPIKKMISLVERKTPLGPEYYTHIEALAKSSPMGGDLSDKKRLVKFVFRGLRSRYWESETPANVELGFSDAQTLLGQLEAMRKWLDPIAPDKKPFSVPMDPEDIEEMIFKDKVARLLWHITIPICSDIINATSPGHK